MAAVAKRRECGSAGVQSRPRLRVVAENGPKKANTARGTARPVSRTKSARKTTASAKTLRSAAKVASAPTKRAASAAASQSAARQAFITFAAVVTVIALLGMGRVWLTVSAAEASMEANRLRAEIKNARYDGDMLEIRQSALGSPSRIKAIAGAAMGMAPASEVTYLELASNEDEIAPAETEQADGGSTLRHVVASALDVTAGGAQALLVGDVGMAAIR